MLRVLLSLYSLSFMSPFSVFLLLSNLSFLDKFFAPTSPCKNQMLHVQEKFVPGTDGPVDIMDEDRVYINDGVFKRITVSGTSDVCRTLFLFNDIILIGKPAAKGKYLLRLVLANNECLVMPGDGAKGIGLCQRTGLFG